MNKLNITAMKEHAEKLVVIMVEAEAINSVELQQKGWQSTLNNFKKYTETDS
jgi:hypothetical protein